MNLLIVEDNSLTGEALAVQLDRYDCHSDWCANGEGAIRHLESAMDKPDAIVLDWVLPDMSGWKLLELIKTNDKWKHLPIVVITGLVDPSIPILLKRFSDVQLVIKPFDVSSLVHSLRSSQ